MPAIDLNHAATFVRVVEAGSFTAAAKALGLPAYAVSRAVGSLENELGVRLMHRTTRKLSLTEAGQTFFGRMQAVIAESDQAASSVAGLSSVPRGLVRVTAPPGLAGERFPEMIAEIVRRYPELTLELMLTNRVVDLVGEGIDLAIRNGMLRDSSLVARRVVASELGIFAAPAYLERCGRPRNPGDLVGRECLSYGGREGRMAWRLRGPGGEQSVEVSGPLVCDDMLFLRAAASAGLGMALMPVEIVAAELKSARLVRVLPRWSVVGGGIYLVWPSQKHVPARVLVVRDMLLEALANYYG